MYYRNLLRMFSGPVPKKPEEVTARPAKGPYTPKVAFETEHFAAVTPALYGTTRDAILEFEELFRLGYVVVGCGPKHMMCRKPEKK